MTKANKRVEETYTLELNKAEAQFLRDVLGRIGGYKETRRIHATDISTVLEEVGLNIKSEDKDVVGSIMFYSKDIPFDHPIREYECNLDPEPPA